MRDIYDDDGFLIPEGVCPLCGEAHRLDWCPLEGTTWRDMAPLLSLLAIVGGFVAWWVLA